MYACEKQIPAGCEKMAQMLEVDVHAEKTGKISACLNERSYHALSTNVDGRLPGNTHECPGVHVEPIKFSWPGGRACIKRVQSKNPGTTLDYMVTNLSAITTLTVGWDSSGYAFVNVTFHPVYMDGIEKYLKQVGLTFAVQGARYVESAKKLIDVLSKHEYFEDPKEVDFILDFIKNGPSKWPGINTSPGTGSSRPETEIRESVGHSSLNQRIRMSRSRT
jgi:hypothetical protein